MIEHRGQQQRLNFDVLIKNQGHHALRLVSIKLTVLDPRGEVELIKEVNENGHPPAIDLAGPRLLEPSGVIDFYQPFTEFGPGIELHHLRYELLFMKSGRPSAPAVLTPDEIVKIDVFPEAYRAAAYCLPLHGRVLVHDGHDFYSHHRRFNLVDRFKDSESRAVSANLFAEDFVAVDASGHIFDGNPKLKESWFSYRQPIFSPQAGEVVEAVDGIAENSFDADGNAEQPADSATADPLGLGNHVKIRHADGRVSWLLHMLPGSVRVRTGEQVRAGQQIGAIGFTGDALFPHLHYNVTASVEYPSQGLPVYFQAFERLVGARRLPAGDGQIDTGDIVQDSGLCR